MKNALSNLMTLALVMIAVSAIASAQTTTAHATRGRIVGGIITVVKTSGTSLQSNDGGKNWQTLDTATTHDVASELEQAMAKRQRLLAMANGTTGTQLMTVNAGQTSKSGAHSAGQDQMAAMISTGSK